MATSRILPAGVPASCRPFGPKLSDTGWVSALDQLLSNPPDLPILAGREDISSSVRPGSALVLSAPAGSGKTTLVPALMATRLNGTVLVAEPRRIAARASARRLAALLGQKVGETVGFSVKGQTCRSAHTRIEFLTPGVLVRRIQSDPSLKGVGAVLLDEFHERHLDVDLALGFLLDVRALMRDDLHICLTSATLDIQRIHALLAGVAPTDCVDVPGVSYPLQIRYSAPPRGITALEADRYGTPIVSRGFLSHVARCACEGFRATRGDVLVIVPGVREINEVVAALGSTLDSLESENVEVCPLHGSLPAVAQDRVLTPHALQARRIVVATPIAESSLTVAGVSCVVDSGLAREPRLDVARAASRLVTVAASKSRCEQRAGRAARLGPGLAIRCFDEVEWAKRPAQAQPEILVADLSESALQAYEWSPDGLAGISLLDVPSTSSLEAACQNLEALGLIDKGHVTPLGHKVARLPLDPPIAASLITSAAHIGAVRAARFAALLGEEPRVGDADLAALLKGLRSSEVTSSRSGEESLALRVEREAKRLIHAASAAEKEAPSSFDRKITDEDALALVVARAHPRWIARARSGGRVFLLADGQAAALPKGSPLEGSQWLAVAALTRSARANGLIRSAVALDQSDAEDIGHAMLKEKRSVVLDDDRVRAQSTRYLGAIPLDTPRNVDASEEETFRVIIDALTAKGSRIFTWSDRALSLRSRISALHEVDPQSWPAVDEESLVASAKKWLAGDLAALAARRRLSSVDMATALTSLLDWSALARLDALAPNTITIPTGATRRIDWSSGRPVLTLRVQEAFGWVDSPVFAEGRLPLVLHLTDPAGRPAAVTSDLASFWAGPYQQVRSELRGRYPKHPWPADPFSERPTSRAKPRR